MTDTPDALFGTLLDIMARLRGPGGCPWDRAQTSSSLKPFLIEEAYEVLEAIESGDARAVSEELGDLLFQVVFHARIAEEHGDFALVNVARLASIDAEDALHGATEKFRRRFTEMEAQLSAQGKSVESVPQAELERAWEAVKATEQGR